MSKIAWCNKTWNCVYGCTEVTRECAHCYAIYLTARFIEPMLAKRAAKLGHPPYPKLTHMTSKGLKWTGKLVEADWRLDIPMKVRKPALWFVNSMSDVFHKKVSDAFIHKMFETMRKCPQHEFQILTKRPERVLKMSSSLDWSPNVWMGTSVGIRASLGRIDLLRGCGAEVKFISAEPLLESLAGIDLTGIDWLIAGGESQPGCRPMNIEWAREMRDASLKAGIPYFLKQLGGHPHKRADDLAVLDGRTWTEQPRVPGQRYRWAKAAF